MNVAASTTSKKIKATSRGLTMLKVRFKAYFLSLTKR